LYLEQQAREHFFYIEAGVVGVAGSQGDVFQIEKHGHGCIGAFVVHC
jgi:hypothetical protein